MSNRIHETAVIHEGAIIADDCSVGPFSVIGPKVKIGAGTTIGSHVVIEGNTTIGKANRIFQFASLGAEPQDLKYHGESSTLEIGDGNIVREYVTLQPGTEGGGMVTRIGDQNLFMACTHIGHDTILGHRNIFANSAAVSGHVVIGDKVTIGGLSGIHQFVKLGDYSFIGAGAMVSQDIPPYCMAQGDRAKLIGVNTVGLKRDGLSEEEVRKISKLFREIFYGGRKREELGELLSDYGEERTKHLIEFVMQSERGVASLRKKKES